MATADVIELDVLVIGEVLVELGSTEPLHAGTTAASLSVGALGGTGFVPDLRQIRAHQSTHQSPARPSDTTDQVELTSQGAHS